MYIHILYIYIYIYVYTHNMHMIRSGGFRKTHAWTMACPGALVNIQYGDETKTEMNTTKHNNHTTHMMMRNPGYGKFREALRNNDRKQRRLRTLQKAAVWASQIPCNARVVGGELHPFSGGTKVWSLGFGEERLNPLPPRILTRGSA